MSTIYVSVSVPEHLLPSVYALILQDISGPEADEGHPPSAAAAVPGNGTWHQHELQELERRVKNPAGRAILTLVAEKGLNGSTSTYEELRVAGESATSDEFDYDNLRAQLSWISKYSKAIRNGVKQWPMEFVDGGAELDKGQRYTYRMPSDVAAWWLAAVSS
jgi:hypothetical protein